MPLYLFQSLSGTASLPSPALAALSACKRVSFPDPSGSRLKTRRPVLLSVAWLFMQPGSGSRRPCSLLALRFYAGDASQLGMTYPERYRRDYDCQQADHDEGKPQQPHDHAGYGGDRCDYQGCRQYGPGASTYGTACRWKHVNTLMAIAAAISVGQ